MEQKQHLFEENITLLFLHPLTAQGNPSFSLFSFFFFRKFKTQERKFFGASTTFKPQKRTRSRNQRQPCEHYTKKKKEKEEKNQIQSKIPSPTTKTTLKIHTDPQNKIKVSPIFFLCIFCAIGLIFSFFEKKFCWSLKKEFSNLFSKKRLGVCFKSFSLPPQCDPHFVFWFPFVVSLSFLVFHRYE